MKSVDMTNKRCGMLKVIKKDGSNKTGRTMWLCICDCGNEIVCEGSKLRNGHTTSCGCKRYKTLKEMKTIHGMHNTRLYSVWNTMKYRCENKNAKEYKYYGGRGITVCDEWRNSFEAFYNWAINNGYDSTQKRGVCTIDRINVNGNYEPSNCRWVNMKVQRNNQRKKALD